MLICWTDPPGLDDINLDDCRTWSQQAARPFSLVLCSVSPVTRLESVVWTCIVEQFAVE
jgi:hypothetical protein